MVAYPALVRPPHAVVLDAIALEYVHLPLIVGNGQGNLDLTPACGQKPAVILLDAEQIGGAVDAGVDFAEGGEFAGGLDHVAFPWVPAEDFPYYTTCPKPWKSAEFGPSRAAPGASATPSTASARRTR